MSVGASSLTAVDAAAAAVTMLLAGAAVLAAGDGVRRRAVLPSGRTLRQCWRDRWRRTPQGGEAVIDLPLLLELVAAAVSAGLPPGTAVEEALAAISASGAGGADRDDLLMVCAQLRLGADPVTAWSAAGEELRPLAEPLVLSTLTGAPPAGLLLAAAIQLRRERRRAAEVAAARLGSLLVLPLGLCTLPSFLLLGVVPVVLTLAQSLLRP